jgi:hypothetical protein
MAVVNGSKSIRSVHSIQCAGCGCGWMVGQNPKNQPKAARIILRGYGLSLVPDCPGCPCHTGIGLLPYLRVTMSE